MVATFAMRRDRPRAVDWMTDGRGWRAQGDPRPYVVEGGPPEHDRPFRRVSDGFAYSFRERSIHIDWEDRDAMAFRISGDDSGRVEAHGLVVQQRDVELGGVVELQMSGVIGGERERRCVALAESELREGGDLSEDLIRDRLVDTLRARAADEWAAQLLHVCRAARAAHRTAQHVRGRRREPRGGDRDAEDLLLEEDDTERLFEDRLEQRMRVLDRLAALPPSDVRVDHVPLQGAGPDDRDLDDDVREVPGPDTREGLRLRAALHPEEPDRVDLGEKVVDRGVVEREGAELEELAVARLDVGDRVLHQRERPQAKEVHLHEAEVLDVTLVELHDVAVRHCRALDRDRVHERQRGDEHPAVVDRQVPWEIGDGEGQLAKEREALALLVAEDLEQIGDRVRHRSRFFPSVLRRTIGVVIRRV